MILNANGAPFHGSELPEGPANISPEMQAKLPTGTTMFDVKTITADERNNLSWQEKEALYEEWFHRFTYIRMGHPCDLQPLHNFNPCLYCHGAGVRVDPDKTKGTCVRCNGVGLIKDLPPITWGCKHLYPQDEIHPVGMCFLPRGYYVCKTCLSLIERKKFKFSQELVMRCYKCINEESFRLYEKNPELVVDFSKKS